jgi:glycerol-1-phosphate dehydrogenase [NAD(P)+]
MLGSELESLLAGKCSPQLIPIKAIQIADGLVGNAGELIRRLELGKEIVVLSDQNTYRVAGELVERSLSSVRKVVSIVLEAGQESTLEAVEYVLRRRQNAAAIVAVGSGSINDIAKYSSFLAKIPYVIFGTAPSMNGYCSATASIVVSGYKQSLPAHLPVAALFDLEVIKRAPLRLVKSGIGDSVCRSTCQADWLLSHLLLGTNYDELPFELTKERESLLYSNAISMINQDKQSLKLLIEILILSGLGMYLAGGSYPASQSEHVLAHIIDTKFPSNPKSLHGEQVAVTSLFASYFQELLLQEAKLIISASSMVTAEQILDFFGANAIKDNLIAVEQKMLSHDQLINLQNKLDSEWSEIKERIKKNMVPARKLAMLLKEVGLASHYADLGCYKEDFINSVRFAHLYRNRFTFLDLANCAGLTEIFVKKIVK